MITTENTGAALVRKMKGDDQSMKRVRITRSTIANGSHAQEGTIIEVSAQEARQLFVAQAAVPVSDEPERPTVRDENGGDDKSEKKLKKKAHGPVARD